LLNLVLFLILASGLKVQQATPCSVALAGYFLIWLVSWVYLLRQQPNQSSLQSAL